MPSVVRETACALDCPDTCDLRVEVDTGTGRVLTVNGGRRSPITEGFICGKVRKIERHVYGSDRVATPLVRAGKKSAGAPFRPASWDEALDLVAARLGEVKARSGGEAILPYHYGGSNGWLTEGGHATRFFRRLGASECLRTLCAAATSAATRGLYGQMPGVALEDFAHARLIVLWGVNPSATGIHLVPFIEQARAAGAKLVVIDPRTTPLARSADLHLAVRPGTDLPVALAIIAALFERDLHDAAFLAQHAVQVEELRRRAAPWTIAEAARVAGITAAELDAFITLYVASNPAVIRAGWGMERNRNGGSAVAAVLALPAVAGKFGVRAGGYTLSNGDARWGLSAEAGIAEPPAGTRGINMSRLAAELAERTDPRIEALFVYNANPASTTPNQLGVRAALGRDDLFVVVHEQVMTDTAALADVVLPATTFLEHRELKRSYGAMRLYDSAPVIAPVGEAWSNNRLFSALGRRMGLQRDDDPDSDEEIVARIFGGASVGAQLRATLDAEGTSAPPAGDRPVPFADVFPGTPDRKIHLVPESLDREAQGLYRWKAVSQDDAAGFPLVLISPALARQISSTFGQLRQTVVPIDIHPADAAARAINDGDRVRVWNALGEVIVPARLTSEVRPGVVSLPKGLWRHHTHNGNTANALIPELLADLGGQAAYHEARVEIAPAGD